MEIVSFRNAGGAAPLIKAETAVPEIAAMQKPPVSAMDTGGFLWLKTAVSTEQGGAVSFWNAVCDYGPIKEIRW